MRKAVQFLFIVLFLLFMAGCGSQSQVTTTPVSTNPADVPVSLSITDTPPAGVTVLFFQLTITGATLTSSSGGTVSLLSSANPIPVNISQLLTDTAFLGSANVPAGTYNSLSLNLANPQLTIFNGSDSAIASTCALNTVCQLQPNTSPLTLTFPSSGASSTAPFPVTLSANSPLAFKLDIHLDAVIQSDLSVNLNATNGVTISQLPAPPSGMPFPHLGHLKGTIQSVNTSASTNGFTLQARDGRTFTIDVNSSTTYNYPGSVCSADNFSCLAPQQIVKVEVSLQTDGTLLASEVDYVQLAGQTTVEGNIIRLSTSGGNTLMDLILQNGPAASSTLPLGHRVTVTVPAGAAYAIDSGSFTLPGGLSFASASDLIVGQEVSVVVQGSVTTASGSNSWTPWTGPAPITFTTNSVTLEPSQITGTVAALPTPQGSLSFTLATKPVFFVPPSATPGATPAWAPVIITVETTSATTFTNFTTDSLSGLALNDIVSVGGRIFSTPSGATAITQAAETVVDRPGVVPLF
jgi:hypothetical protein